MAVHGKAIEKRCPHSAISSPRRQEEHKDKGVLNVRADRFTGKCKCFQARAAKIRAKKHKAMNARKKRDQGSSWKPRRLLRRCELKCSKQLTTKQNHRIKISKTLIC